MKATRKEARIFADLVQLTASPGYAHAIASICIRDDVIVYQGELKPEDLDHVRGRERLNRNELITLIGLMVKQPLDLNLPAPEVVADYVSRTDTLMEELHYAIDAPSMASIMNAVTSGGTPPNPWKGAGMREPIFYGSESAYVFQYRDFVPEKYGADDGWLIKNKGFSSTQARDLARSMCSLMDKKGMHLLNTARKTKVLPDSWLPGFEFTVEEVVADSSLPLAVVEAFFAAFTLTGSNAGFLEVGDFNEVAACPLLPTDRGTYLLFTYYQIVEALYESPFFWMLGDTVYQPEAADHRGAFTEQFATRRLTGVFGSEHVHANVNLHRGKDIVGEADVLVAFGDRLIIVQAKAKKLTIAARKGNDQQLQKDFAAAIQDAYDQGWGCATEMLKGGCRLVGEDGNEITLPLKIKEVFIFCLVSEHYPALAFQAKESLQFKTTDVIQPPYVMDVFLLDTLTEMLRTPLRLLSYVKLRVAATEKIVSGHELTVLGYHLRQNLWLDAENDFVLLDDSIAQELDAAMFVRRDGQPGNDTPAGILTRMRGTNYERLIRQIENRPDWATLELGLHLLSLSEDSCMNVHRLLTSITQQTKRDAQRHDATLTSGGADVGICFHCNVKPSPEAISVLEYHSHKRKYFQKAPTWFGVSVSPDVEVQFGITLDFPWSYSKEWEQETAGMKAAADSRVILPSKNGGVRLEKHGRNDPCPCGSGRKFKKCCLR